MIVSHVCNNNEIIKSNMSVTAQLFTHSLVNRNPVKFCAGSFSTSNFVLFLQQLLGPYRNKVLSQNEGRNTREEMKKYRSINRMWVAKTGTIRK